MICIECQKGRLHTIHFPSHTLLDRLGRSMPAIVLRCDYCLYDQYKVEHLLSQELIKKEPLKLILEPFKSIVINDFDVMQLTLF